MLYKMVWTVDSDIVVIISAENALFRYSTLGRVWYSNKVQRTT
jgi:hypothetical protein